MTQSFVRGLMAAAIAPLAAWGSLALAQSGDCRNPQTQQELNRCSAQELQNADRQLNQTYRQLRRTIQQRAGTGPDGKAQENRLIDAQLAWITFRDRHCAFVRRRVAGGSIAPLAVNLCLTRLTQERTAELARFLQEGAI
jgi:uncharacterized protein YecT (DUF1311 family)